MGVELLGLVISVSSLTLAELETSFKLRSLGADLALHKEKLIPFGILVLNSNSFVNAVEQSSLVLQVCA